MTTLTPDYPDLPGISFLLGTAFLVVSVFSLLRPAAARKLFTAFPRDKASAAVLTVLALGWSYLWLYIMPLGFLIPVRPYISVLFPISVAAVWLLLPDLLSCRAAGGVLALLPTPLISAAAWHPSPWRYAVLAVAYIMAVAGMCYIAWPWMLRDNISFVWSNPRRAAAFNSAVMCLGILFVVLSFTAFAGADLQT